MARKRSLLFYRLSAILKYFILGLFVTLFVIICPYNYKLLAVTPTAQTLTQVGFQQLYSGQPRAAIKTWEKAYEAYHRLKDSEGMTGSLINQSIAFQTIGSYNDACETLIKVLEFENFICKNPQFQQISLSDFQQRLKHNLQKQPLLQLRIIALANLGDVLRFSGNPSASSIVLEKADEMVQSLGLTETTLNDNLILSRGNTERTLYLQAKSRYNITDDPEAKQEALIVAQKKIQSALVLYQKLTKKKNELTVKALLNQLSLILELEKWKEIKKYVVVESKPLAIQTCIKQLFSSLQELENLPAIDSIYNQINLAEAFIQISQNTSLSQAIFGDDDNSLPIALSIANKALFTAQKINNEQTESFALGTIGKIYDYLGQTPKSIQYFKTAMALAQSVRAWDIAYQWQWQLGRLYGFLGQYQQALKYYTNAINSLDEVRNNILGVNLELQFNFTEKVEPVYSEYIELLFSQKEPKLKQVITTQEKLNIVELETFLQCGKLPVFSLLSNQNKLELPPTIYLIKLKNKIEVIVRNENHISHHSVDLKLVTSSIESLYQGLKKQKSTTVEKSNLLIHAQTVYNLLFSPIKQYLPDSGTLIVVPDSYFQNFPISVLYDGTNYLNKYYSFSTMPSSEFWQIKALKPQNMKALVAGISEIGPSFFNILVPKNFQALPEVNTEILNIIKNTAPGSKLLLNAEFTKSNLQEKMKDNLPILHLSTHGQFSSDPEKTFVLTWDLPVTARELRFLLKTEQTGIDLLVLSACQTAKGDRRSALGIAGIAAQAGARSTIASLWLVDAESTAQLMNEFYKALKNGMTKAEALRQAQLVLISNPKYSDPYFWAGFILIGSWL